MYYHFSLLRGLLNHCLLYNLICNGCFKRLAIGTWDLFRYRVAEMSIGSLGLRDGGRECKS